MRAMLSLVVLLGLLLGLQAQPAASAKPTTLHAGDVVAITVFGFQTYGGEFAVFDDGTISGPGFGQVEAEGLTLEQLRGRVEEALSKSLKDPTVRVVLKSQRRQVVYVLSLGDRLLPGATPGAAGGPVPIMPGMTLRQLVAAVTLPGAPDELDATLVRRDGTRFPIDLASLVRAEPDQWNGLIEPDDTLLLVAKRSIRIWLVGSLAQPGERRVREGTDVYQAIAAGGGVAAQGSEGQGTVIQPELLEEMSLFVQRGPESIPLPLRAEPGEPGFVLQSGDVVHIQPPKRIRVTLGGDVAVPGTYLLATGAGLGRAVAVAGGLTPSGTLAGAMVMRGVDLFRVDGTGPAGGATDAPFALESGDFVFVPRNERAVYALGTVTTPGKFLIPDGQAWRATDLLASAGGVAERGTHRRVTLLRAGPGGKVEQTRFNIDEFLKDGRLESNPVLQTGDVLFFGEPKGISMSSLSVLGQAAFYFDALFGIRR